MRAARQLPCAKDTYLVETLETGHQHHIDGRQEKQCQRNKHGVNPATREVASPLVEPVEPLVHRYCTQGRPFRSNMVYHKMANLHMPFASLHVEQGITGMTALQNNNVLADLRHSTFDLLVISIGVVSGALIWLGNIYVRTSPAEVGLLWLALEGLCGVAYLLRRERFALAVYVLLIGLWLLNGVAYLMLAQIACLYLFALISLATSVLISRLSASFVTLASSLFMIMVQAGSATTFPALLTLLLTLLTGLIAFHGLNRALDLAF